jgi:hypothetical protein
MGTSGSVFSREPTGDDVPGHDVPPGFEVVGAAILVVQIIGVLPDVAGEQAGAVSLVKFPVLIGGGGDLQFLRGVIDDEEGPAGAEDAE